MLPQYASTYVIATLSLPPSLAYLGLPRPSSSSPLLHPTALPVPSLPPGGGASQPTRHYHHPRLPHSPHPLPFPCPPFLHPSRDAPRDLLLRLHRPLPPTSGCTPADTSSTSASRSVSASPAPPLLSLPLPPLTFTSSFPYPTARHPLLADTFSQTYRRPSPLSRTSV
ncbi:hypothetical protein DFH09DRAFT_1334269 [Mycena vulgaris]|nr:hypothetical protein DFH09DRAFT_1334269 [Mycena vulgaris]